MFPSFKLGVIYLLIFLSVMASKSKQQTTINELFRFLIVETKTEN